MMMLIDKLRLATRPLHDELDQAMMPRIMQMQSINDYIDLLIAFYGFFKPVYDQIDSHLNQRYLPDYNSRRKPAGILHNLQALGYKTTVEKISGNLPGITCNAEAFGALYVMEGSTLGGLMITKMIAGKLHLTDEQLSFFAGYGKKTKERWHQFTGALDNVPVSENDEQKMIQAAAETFSLFKSWLQHSGF